MTIPVLLHMILFCTPHIAGSTKPTYTTTMEKPAQEIDAIVRMLTSAASPDIQKAAIQRCAYTHYHSCPKPNLRWFRFYTSDAGFRHPLCYIPSAYNSREDILGVYQ